MSWLELSNLPLLEAIGVLGGATSISAILQPYIDANGGVMLPLQDTSGLVAVAYNTALATGRDVVINGGFDSDTVWSKGDGWSIAAGIASCDGSQAGNSDLTQNIPMTTGATYRLSFTISGFSAGNLTVRLGGTFAATLFANGNYSYDLAAGATGQAFFRANADFVGNVDNVSVKQINIAASSAFSTPGDNPLDGTITSATIAEPGPLADYSVLFDNANDYIDKFSPELNSILDVTQGHIGIYAKVSGAGVWTDNARRVLCIMRADDNNYISLEKNTSNELEWNYKAGGTLETVVLATTPSGWFRMDMNWDTGGVGMSAFYNGAQTGSDQAIAGTWVGNLDSTTCVIGAASTAPVSVWDGYLAYDDLMRDNLADADILAISEGGGVA